MVRHPIDFIRWSPTICFFEHVEDFESYSFEGKVAGDFVYPGGRDSRTSPQSRRICPGKSQDRHENRLAASFSRWPMLWLGRGEFAVALRQRSVSQCLAGVAATGVGSFPDPGHARSPKRVGTI